MDFTSPGIGPVNNSRNQHAVGCAIGHSIGKNAGHGRERGPHLCIEGWESGRNKELLPYLVSPEIIPVPTLGDCEFAAALREKGSREAGICGEGLAGFWLTSATGRSLRVRRGDGQREDSQSRNCPPHPGR